MKRRIKKWILCSDRLLQQKAPVTRQYILQLLRRVPVIHRRLAALQAKDFKMERDLFLPATANALSPHASRTFQQLSKRRGRRFWWG